MTPILVYVIFAVSLFTVTNINHHIFMALSITLLLFIVPFDKVKRGFLPIMLFLVFTFGGNVFFHHGRIVYDYGFLSITDEGLRISGIRTLRVFSMIYGAKILTHLIPLDKMINVMERIFSPFEKTGLPVRDFFSVMGLTLKAFPVLINYLSNAYRANLRSNEISGLRSRIRNTVMFLMPVFIKSIRSPESFFISENNDK